MVDAYNSALEGSAQLASRAFLTRFVGNFTIDPKVTSVAGVETPTLKINDKVLNNDSEEVDQFTLSNGAIATIFVRKGDDLVRISTSLKKEDGTRAIGTALDRSHPAYAKLMAREAFLGKGTLFGSAYMTRYAPLQDGAGTLIGALFIGQDFTDDLKALKEKIRRIKLGDTGYFYVLDSTPGRTYGDLAVHPAKEGENVLASKDSDGKEFIKAILKKKNGLIHYPWINKELNETFAREKTVAYREFPAWNWVIAGGTYTDELERGKSTLFKILIGASLSAVVLLCAMLYWAFKRMISVPLDRAIGVASRVARGDLTSKIQASSGDEVGRLMNALKDMNNRLADLVGQVRSGVDTISVGSQQIAAGNANLSQRTEEQASSLEETAASMEELTSTVKQSADNARQANQLAAGASEIAVKGGEVVGQVVSTMSGISESSKKIADIIGVIDGIAFQTNILALNAAVEAARAGEQGRGFAVVASEVRTLAQRSAAAAKEIKVLITDSVHEVEGGTKLVGEAGKTMEDIVTAVKRVTDIMAAITAAAQEQSSGIEQVNQAVMQMDQVTQQNAALVEEAAAAADSMQQQAQGLAQAVAVFKVSQEATVQTAPIVRAEPVEPRVERRGPTRAQNVARLAQSNR